MTVKCDENSGQIKNDLSFATGMASLLAGQCHFCNFAKVHNWGEIIKPRHEAQKSLKASCKVTFCFRI